MRVAGVCGGLMWLAALGMSATAGGAQGQAKGVAASQRAATCVETSFEGSVVAGEEFRQVFATPGGGGAALMLVVQPLASGWIVRVVPATGAWGEHDRAELATPPYRSPNPLLVTTDFAFRAQDAVAWNPRRFRYAADDAAFAKLGALYPKVMANDGAAMTEVAGLTVGMPEGEFRVLDATIAPGTADQWRMAAAVASHLESTPHEVAQGMAATPLGKITAMKFRVSLEVPAGFRLAAGLPSAKNGCVLRPTT